MRGTRIAWAALEHIFTNQGDIRWTIQEQIVVLAIESVEQSFQSGP